MHQKRLTCSYLSSLPNVMDIMAVLPFILETSLIMIPNSDRSWFPQALSGGWDYSLDFLEVLKPVKGLTFRFCALRAYFASFASSSCPNCKRWKQCWGIYSFGSQRGRICISDLGTLWFLSRVFNLFAFIGPLAIRPGSFRFCSFCWVFRPSSTPHLFIWSNIR